MPQICSICRHEKRAEIDAALIGNGPLRPMAARYGLSKTSLIRHRANCISVQLAKARELQESEGATDLVHRLREIHAETGAILERAKKAKDWATALRAITRLERQIELEAELLGELERGGRGGETRIEVVYIDKQLVVSAPGAVQRNNTPQMIEAAGESGQP